MKTRFREEPSMTEEKKFPKFWRVKFKEQMYNYINLKTVKQGIEQPS